MNTKNRRGRIMTRVGPARPRVHASRAWLLPGALALLLAACGSSKPTRPSPPSGGAAQVPSSLLGKYTTKLKRSDLPGKPPPELTEGSRTWKLTIAHSGGVNGRPTFTITNAHAPFGPLESSPFSVQGNDILLHNEECDARNSATLLDNEYSYKLSGQTLIFKTVKNQCSDQVAQTILTSEPWRRTAS
jgi:hypothetical protein